MVLGSRKVAQVTFGLKQFDEFCSQYNLVPKPVLE
jgi:hypothetical protein